MNSDVSIRPRRSLLFVPGLRPDRFRKAVGSNADLVCVDLEDAVPLERKREARELTLPLFAEGVAGDVETVVRVNPLSTLAGLEDILALRQSSRPPQGLMLAKPGSAAEVRLYDDLLQGNCADIRFHVIIESAEGLANVMEIAAATPRTASLLFGAVDLSADLRAEKSWETLLYARSRVVHAAARNGLDLLDVPWLDLADQDGLKREAERSNALGFSGKASIHPKQIPVINEVFSPAAEEVERARRIVAAFEKDETGLLVVDGELIERPVLRTMLRTLAVAEQLEG